MSSTPVWTSRSNDRPLSFPQKRPEQLFSCSGRLDMKAKVKVARRLLPIAASPAPARHEACRRSAA